MKALFLFLTSMKVKGPLFSSRPCIGGGGAVIVSDGGDGLFHSSNRGAL